jgi:hypothetical protein
MWQQRKKTTREEKLEKIIHEKDNKRNLEQRMQVSYCR